MDLSASDSVLPQIKDAAVNMNPFAFASTKGGRKKSQKKNQKKRQNQKKKSQKNKKSQKKRQQQKSKRQH